MFIIIENGNSFFLRTPNYLLNQNNSRYLKLIEPLNDYTNLIKFVIIASNCSYFLIQEKVLVIMKF